MGQDFKVQASMVPPPKEIPADQIAETLGLLAGLRAERRNSACRCNQCGKYGMEREWLVWVPVSVDRDDSAVAVSEQCRKNARNGDFSGWCLSCALKLGKANKPKLPETAFRIVEPISPLTRPHSPKSHRGIGWLAGVLAVFMALAACLNFSVGHWIIGSFCMLLVIWNALTCWAFLLEHRSHALR